MHYAFNCGSGTLTLTSKRPFNDGQWHAVRTENTSDLCTILLKIRVRHVFLNCGQIILKNIWKSVTIRKFCKNVIKCQQAEFHSSIRLDFTAERVKWFILIYKVKIFFLNSSSCILICPAYTNHRNIGRSVTVVKSFERSFICHQAELICSNCLDFTTESVQSSP